MSDEPEKKRRLVISPRDHLPKKETGEKYATKDDLIAAMSTGYLAMGQKVYNQAMEETARMLAEMEARLVDITTLSVSGDAVVFVKLQREASEEEMKNIAASTQVIAKRTGALVMQVPHDIDLTVCGEAELTRLGLMRIPDAPVPT